MNNYEITVTRRAHISETASFKIKASNQAEAEGVAATLVARHNAHGDPELTWSKERVSSSDIGDAVVENVKLVAVPTETQRIVNAIHAAAARLKL